VCVCVCTRVLIVVFPCVCRCIHAKRVCFEREYVCVPPTKRFQRTASMRRRRDRGVGVLYATVRMHVRETGCRHLYSAKAGQGAPRLELVECWKYLLLLLSRYLVLVWMRQISDRQHVLHSQTNSIALGSCSTGNRTRWMQTMRVRAL